MTELECPERLPRALTGSSWVKLISNGLCIMAVATGGPYLWHSMTIGHYERSNDWIVSIPVLLGIIWAGLQGTTFFKLFYYAWLLQRGAAAKAEIRDLKRKDRSKWASQDTYEAPDEWIIEYLFVDKFGQSRFGRYTLGFFEQLSGMTLPNRDEAVTVLYDVKKPERNIPYRFTRLAVVGGRNWLKEWRRSISIGHVMKEGSKEERTATIVSVAIALIIGGGMVLAMVLLLLGVGV